MKVQIVTAIAVAALAVAGCASGGNDMFSGAGSSVTGSSGSVSSSAPTVVSTPESYSPGPEVRNAQACEDARLYLTGNVAATLNLWAARGRDLSDAKIAEQLRTEGTHLYRLETSAHGTVARAIDNEAAALTSLSVAMDTASPLDAAANHVNSGLAQLRGICNF